MYGDGLCLESLDQRRAVVHALAGGAERHDYDICLCAAGRLAVGTLGNCCAMGHFADFGGVVHRHSSGARAAVAACVTG